MAKLPTKTIDPEIDFKPITFGANKGKTPEEVSMVNPNYIIWGYDKYGVDFCSAALYNDCKADREKEKEVKGPIGVGAQFR